MFAGGQGLPTTIIEIKADFIKDKTKSNYDLLINVLSDTTRAPVHGIVSFDNKVQNTIILPKINNISKEIDIGFGRCPNKDKIGCPAKDICIFIIYEFTNLIRKNKK